MKTEKRYCLFITGQTEQQEVKSQKGQRTVRRRLGENLRTEREKGCSECWELGPVMHITQGPSDECVLPGAQADLVLFEVSQTQEAESTLQGGPLLSYELSLQLEAGALIKIRVHYQSF